MNIGERIKIVRKDNGLTQKQFANRLSMATSMICLMENGKAIVTDRTAKSICKEFPINYDWLINGNGDMYVTDGEFLISKLINMMETYMSLPEIASIASKHMTKKDWERANNLLREMGC